MKHCSFGMLLAGMLALLLPATATAQEPIAAQLSPFNSVPANISPATATFVGEISADGQSLDYAIEYKGLRGDITQIHIHVGQQGVNGGIPVFICTNVGNGPPGTPTCPASPGEISGTITADNLIPGAMAQGVGVAGFGFQRFLRAVRNGVSYANIHSSLFPAGELRGQLGMANP